MDTAPEIDIETALGIKNADTKHSADNIKELRLNRLTAIFTRKATELRKLAIDKPYMHDLSSISAQEKVYDEMYHAALSGFYDEDTNKAIIEANRKTRYLLAKATLLMNEVRSIIEKKIYLGSDKADELLSLADSVVIDKYNITDDGLEKLKEIFGI